MNRRELLCVLAAGAVMTAEGLWMPGRKLISIPNNIEWKFFPGGVLSGDPLPQYAYFAGRRVWNGRPFCEYVQLTTSTDSIDARTTAMLKSMIEESISRTIRASIALRA